MSDPVAERYRVRWWHYVLLLAVILVALFVKDAEAACNHIAASAQSCAP